LACRAREPRAWADLIEVGSTASTRSDQFGDRSTLDEILRSSSRVDDLGDLGVDAQVVVERGDDLLHVDGSILGMLAEAVGRADGLAAADAPPAMKAQLTGAQWSRPACLFTRGVRPNSPQAMTVTSSSMPRRSRSSIRALRPWSSFEPWSRTSVKLSPWLSQRP
jgi:hypothetical protein